MILELDKVSVTFSAGPPWRRRQVPAMREVSLSLADGEILGLVGESGSGKTTTSMVALGLRRPTSGTALFQNQPFPKRRKQLAGRMQAVLQHPQWSLNPRMRVGQCVAEPLVVFGGVSKAEVAKRVMGILDQVGLDPSFADRYPHQLSGGQRQRVSIARALITRPPFIVFDEAVSALDVSVQAQILNLIKDLRAEYAFAALFISHDIGAVRYVADHVAVLRHGAVVETAPAAVFFGTPEHEYSRQLVEAL
ncbi:peptide/nickel transport system ATP-binding protein/oligopeptide transport system ATP-binding protein [Tamaricihabitans halophyticus]|uniref:Peptide/nickel transport system ATP-binding protein/oligopeptide transport system ATP-binding protein n=1 Tax=Tamaricihabitans halophyticus TaxID=1262583 RepID=A0A4R2QKH5_9PSEU|nr:ATP-binding cassette domain-containing protein [Tamaricihabitans halophyticus]TCP49940.1 peptide/nickel transport system ATP-binding protein/oligopeptide transport system ATP-binding protein [Tamaricihabitans halophyticus]